MPAQRFFRFIDRHAGQRRRTILVGGLGSGLLQGLTVAVIGMGLDEFVMDRTVSARVMLLFLICIASFYWSFRLAMTASTGVALEAVSGMQMRISDKLRRMDYSAFSRLEESHVYTTVMGNTDIVYEAARHLVSFMSGAAMMTCAFLYAATVSLPGMLLVVGILAACGMVFMRMQSRAFDQQTAVRQRSEALMACLKDLLEGFTELRMNQARSDDLYANGIRAHGRELVEAERDIDGTSIRGTAFFATLAFLPVGATIFLLPRFASINPEQLIKLIAVTLFSLGPLMGMVFFIPMVTKAQVTIDALEAFDAMLDDKQEAEPPGPPVAPEFTDIRMQNGSFSYEAPRGQQPFTLTLDDFSLSRGEMVFLTGGNGSGKTTFMRILAGLLHLDSGTIQVDGRPLGQVGLENYRALFSVIFSDFHLFGTLYGQGDPDPARVNELIDKMRLTGKVGLRGRGFSTTELSSGQRKRLALICALLEDRPVLLLDEVAADFDFQFRDYFYHTLLPELRASGKTILAISHDDRYFHVADRVLIMRYGTIEPPAGQSSPGGPGEQGGRP